MSPYLGFSMAETLLSWTPIGVFPKNCATSENCMGGAWWISALVKIERQTNRHRSKKRMFLLTLTLTKSSLGCHKAPKGKKSVKKLDINFYLFLSYYQKNRFILQKNNFCDFQPICNPISGLGRTDLTYVSLVCFYSTNLVPIIFHCEQNSCFCQNRIF